MHHLSSLHTRIATEPELCIPVFFVYKMGLPELINRFYYKHDEVRLQWWQALKKLSRLRKTLSTSSLVQPTKRLPPLNCLHPKQKRTRKGRRAPKGQFVFRSETWSQNTPKPRRRIQTDQELFFCFTWKLLVTSPDRESLVVSILRGRYTSWTP
jgi:hypothetical protein